MKTRILLIDESITVQKVVSLTLDKSQYALVFAKSRADAAALIPSELPDVILISDQVPGIHIASFPKELETWLGGQKVPPVVLIATGEAREARHYSAVLKKPFTPQALKSVIEELTEETPGYISEQAASSDEDPAGLEKILQNAFPDESELTRQTFGHSLMEERKAAKPELWTHAPPSPPQAPLQEKPRFAYGEKAVEQAIHSLDLEEVVDRALTRILPPIIERLVQERLDLLLKEQERFIDAKP